MMDVSANTLTKTNPQEQNQVPASVTKKTLDYDAFLKLLIAQIKYQDPTQPLDPTEQVSQLATFSTVEQSIKTNTKLDSLLTAFALSQADGVMGRTITSADGEISGKVMSMRIVEGGAVAILDNGKEVTLGSGVRIS